MTWQSHIAIGTAISLPFSPFATPLAILGSTAPDWIEMILRFFGIHIKHRGETHFLIIPLSLILFSFALDFNGFLFWFGMGYLSHWIADSLTISGVPISPLDKNKFTLFGGKIKTGEPLEFIISFGLLAISLLIAKPSIDFFIRNEPSYFNAYYMNYKELNEKKIIDNKEYLEKRFKFF